MPIYPESVKGVLFRSRMTAWLDDMQEADEPSSDEDEPQHREKETKDWKSELEKFRAETYHYRQPVVMYTIVCELEFMGGFMYPPTHLECTRAVVILSRNAKYDLETLDYLKHDEPARYQKACIGFEKLYGFSADKFESRAATLPEEVLECLTRRITLKHSSAWANRPEEQRKLIETCDWIIKTCMEFPVNKIKTSFGELRQAMEGAAKAPMQELVKDLTA